MVSLGHPWITKLSWKPTTNGVIGSSADNKVVLKTHNKWSHWVVRGQQGCPENLCGPWARRRNGILVQRAPSKTSVEKKKGRASELNGRQTPRSTLQTLSTPGCCPDRPLWAVCPACKFGARRFLAGAAGWECFAELHVRLLNICPPCPYT